MGLYRNASSRGFICWLALAYGPCLPGQSPEVAGTHRQVAPTVVTSAPVANPPARRLTAEPAISDSSLSLASRKVRTLHLAPGFSTAIRVGEAVSSVVVGDPERFLAEHADAEPTLVFVKPTTTATAFAESNLVITTVKGHTIALLLTNDGGSSGRTVDVLLNLDEHRQGLSRFLVDETVLPRVVVPESAPIGTSGESKPEATLTSAAVSGSEAPAPIPAPPSGGTKAPLDQLLARQRTAPLPALYGQKPGKISQEPLLKAGVSEVIDGGEKVIVLFSVKNPAKHAIELLPPQVQLGGKDKKRRWQTAEQLAVSDYRLSLRRVAPGGRADGVVVFERPAWKMQKQTLFLQMAESAAVDQPALAPIGFGISTIRGGVAGL